MITAGGVLVLAACGSPAQIPRATTASSRPTTTTSAQSTTTSAHSVSTTSSTVPYGAPPWTVLSTDSAGVAVEEQTVTVPSGHVVTLVRFDAGRVVFDLHIGSTDPPVNLATIPADRGPAIAADETPFLLAAFEGGFKIKDGPGGVVLLGQVVAPLSDGKASFVIDANGTAHIGVWGSGLPLPGEQVASVRQNLAPLITNRVPSPAVNDPAAWGATLTSNKIVPRSARRRGRGRATSFMPAAGPSSRPTSPRRCSTPARSTPCSSTSTPNGCSSTRPPPWGRPS